MEGEKKKKKKRPCEDNRRGKEGTNPKHIPKSTRMREKSAQNEGNPISHGGKLSTEKDKRKGKKKLLRRKRHPVAVRRRQI